MDRDPLTPITADDLASAIGEYMAAHEATMQCPSMILSSGRTEEASRIMSEMQSARDDMFALAHLYKLQTRLESKS